MDADGTKDGFDTDMLPLIRAAVGVPLIASGGAGALRPLPGGHRRRRGRGAGRVGVPLRRSCGSTQVKRELAAAGYPVREALTEVGR